jgi:hypothetical protein
MEEHRSTAGQGLGIAGLVLGILAIPLGIFPCTFYVGIIFGVVGIVISVVALSQASRAFAPKALIIAALICSILGLSFASIWGIILSRGGARMVKEIMDEGLRGDRHVRHRPGDAKEILKDLESDSAEMEKQTDESFEKMKDTLKVLEGIEE